MTWIKLDDGFISHPKTMSLSHKSIVLHIAGLTYCCAQLTDGHITKAALPMVLATARVGRPALDPLLAVGMWREQGEQYVIHDFLQYQESRDDVLKRREKWANHKRRSRDVSTVDSTVDSTQESGGESTDPDPTRPISTIAQSALALVPEPSDGFDAFWAIYPKRVDKKRAAVTWRRLKKSDRDAVMLDVPRRINGWAKDGNRFVPNPSKYLTGRRWEDEDGPREPRAQVVNGERRAPGATW